MKYLRLLMGRDNLAISCPPMVYCSLKNGLLDGALKHLWIMEYR